MLPPTGDLNQVIQYLETMSRYEGNDHTLVRALAKERLFVIRRIQTNTTKNLEASFFNKTTHNELYMLYNTFKSMAKAIKNLAATAPMESAVFDNFYLQHYVRGSFNNINDRISKLQKAVKDSGNAHSSKGGNLGYNNRLFNNNTHAKIDNMFNNIRNNANTNLGITDNLLLLFSLFTFSMLAILRTPTQVLLHSQFRYYRWSFL